MSGVIETTDRSARSFLSEEDGTLAEKPELTGIVIVLLALPETAVILGFVVAALILFL